MKYSWLILGSLAACGGSGGGGSLAELENVGVTPLGTLYSLAFDHEDTPWIGMSTGFHRFDGTTWQMIPNAGITAVTAYYLRFDSQGGAMIGGGGTAFRFPPGGSAWEPLNSDGLLYEAPIEASDGTLYSAGIQPALGRRKVYFRRSGETAWSDTGAEVDPDWSPVADRDGNIWINTWSGGGADDGVMRIRETQHERIPAVWGNAPMLGDIHLLIGADAAGLYGASVNYGHNYGEVYRWDPDTRTRTTLSDGESCSEIGEFECTYEGGTFFGGNTRAPDGDIFQMFAHQNGEPPTLMVLPSGSGTWRPLVTDLTPGVAMATNSASELFLFGNVGGGSAVARVLR